MPDYPFIPTGLDGLDAKLDYVRPGDNVVSRVQALTHFAFFSNALLRRAKEDGRCVHYIHFQMNEALPSLSEERDGLVIHTLDPHEGFELFSLNIRDVIDQAGDGQIFIFDCLTWLQELWATDIMMANFVRITAPYFTAHNAVVYYPIMHGVHSYDSLSNIRESIQIFLDIYYSEPSYYITPLKVQNRYHAKMYIPHRVDPDESFHPMTYSSSLSKYYAVLDEAGDGEQMHDSWETFFSLMRLRYANGELTEKDSRQMCAMMMTKEKHIRSLILQHFKPRDYIQLQRHMVGTGMIGGKACGMLLARKIIRNCCPEVSRHMEPHDSYYIGADIYYTYIIHNGCWDLWLSQKRHPEKRALADEMRNRLLNGKFPGTIRREFKRLLDYFGTSPIIVRSSSLLEDGFGNAFAGKYDSVFCVNGESSLSERLLTFENAIRTVYASTMSASALEYRRQRGLLKKDEQMALLVQRVSGSRFEKYYLPMAAGVGYSYNSYPWTNEIDPAAGMLRLVAGLGTRAVDRTPGDYPRLISLDKPTLTTFSTTADRHKFSQHRMDLLDLDKNALSNKPVEELYSVLLPWQRKQIFSHDYDTERMFRDRGQFRQVFFADCERLVKNEEFISCMQKLLSTLQKEYGAPVDIEYTINFSETDEFQISLLQCRPLQSGDNANISLPAYEDKQVFLHVTKNCMGNSRKKPLDVVVYIDPYSYYTWPHAKKPQIARCIGAVNHFFDGQHKNMLLITPGRIGTSSPELGVPVSYAEISQFSAIMEEAYSKAGYMPELSFGSHMFQDLVEAGILYIAAMENKDTITFRPDYLEQFPEIGSGIVPKELSHIVRVYDTSGSGLTLAFDSMKREVLIGK